MTTSVLNEKDTIFPKLESFPESAPHVNEYNKVFFQSRSELKKSVSSTWKG